MAFEDSKTLERQGFRPTPQPYPAYKPSGVEWLGDVPAHWDVRRLGSLLRERGETNDDGGVTEVLSVLRNRGVIPYSQKGNIGNKKSEDITRYKIVRPNDIVMNSMNVIIGSVGLSRYAGCLSPVYYVLTNRSNEDLPEYLNANFQTKPFQRSLVRIGNGILAHRMRIPMELLKCELFPRPPLPEQRAIVRYLDHVDDRIRRYVSAKERLIALLEEERQAVIHRAVTRALDPDVRLKPSGVEWLDDVPAHWEVTAVKRHYSIQLGKMLQNSALRPSDVKVPYLKAQHVQWFFVRTTDELTMWASPNEIEQFGVRSGDLLVCEGGEGGRCGIVKEAQPKQIIQNALHRVRATRKCKNEYLQYVMSSVARTGWFEAINSKATIAHFTVEKFASLVLAIPPLPEQTAIVDYLDEATANIDAAIARARRQIELLREYRTRLIADVVTGKLDVREAAANLPERDGN